MNSSQRRQAVRSGQAERDDPSLWQGTDRDLVVRRALEAGLMFHRTGDFQVAAEFYYEALDAYPEQQDALHLLGLISHQSGDNETAERLIQRSIQVSVRNPVAHITLGDVYQSAGRHEDAIQAYRQGLEIDPDCPEAHNNCGNAYHALGRFEAAAACYKHALALKPGYAAALNNLGNTQREMGSYQEAVVNYRQALAFHPDSATIHDNLGSALRDRGELELAVECHRTAIEIAPGAKEAHFNLGNVFSDLGRIDEAASHYRRAIEIDPRFADAHYNLGNLHRERGDLIESVRCFQRAVSIAPDHADAYNNLGNVLNDLGRYDQALSAFRIVLQLDPERANARHLYAALSGERTDAAPPGYVRDLYDHYASQYEAILTEELDYHAPRALRAVLDAVPRHDAIPFTRVLDLGCGTGLAIEALDDISGVRVGVDLSPNMIAAAAAKGLYDELHESDIAVYLEEQAQSGAASDLVVAADSFIYTGDLRQIFAAVGRMLCPAGLFSFTTEVTTVGDYALQRSGRYAHSDRYVTGLANSIELTVAARDTILLRTENGNPVFGTVFVLRHAPGGSR